MKCRLCKNHGISTALRGHKYNCPFRSCSCFNCKTTLMRNVEQTRNRVNVKRIHGHQHNESNEVESDENQKVIAWINGEEIQEETAGK